jgi:hypothetical protein
VTNVKAALESKGNIGKAQEEEGGKAKGQGRRRKEERRASYFPSHVATIIPYYMHTYTPDYLPISPSRSA